MNITTIDPFEDPEVVLAIVEIYQQAFGGKPWDEGYVCPACENTVSLDSGVGLCSECEKNRRSIPMVEYWPTSKVLSDFYREMSKDGADCMVAIEDTDILGFAWGYRVSVTPELASSLEAPGLDEIIEGNYFYLDECAIRPAYQGQGIGRQIMESIFPWRRLVLLRTMDESRMCRLVKSMGGKIVQHISRGRVIMTLEDRSWCRYK